MGRDTTTKSIVKASITNTPEGFLSGGGEMGGLMRALDWSASALGPPESWPQSLRTAVSILLNSRYPMFVFWGPRLVKIYNDAYRPITGAKHPWCLGRPGPEVWPEIWDTIGPMVERVVQHGESTWSDDLLLFMHRNGYPEEVYFTFSYSPIREESGGIGGMFCACTETTQKVLGERRLKTLRDLAAEPAHVRTVAEVCRLSSDVLATNPYDIPFARIYLLDPKTGDVHPALPENQSGIGDDILPHLIRVARSGKAAVIDGVTNLPSVGPWPEPPRTAAIFPIIDRGNERPIGLLVLGISSRRAFDDDYEGFFRLCASEIASCLANARASEEERKRAEALAEIDRAKTVFFSNISHEFRTPLTLMLASIEDVLTSASERPDEQLRSLLVAQRNGLRLLRLVNMLLDFARVEAGRMQGSFEPVDLATLTADLTSSFRSACEKAGLALRVACPSLPEPVWVDPGMWELIVLNLISNAFKFTLDGEIEVGVRPSADGRAAELVVRDTGIGIPEAERLRIFERFHRVRDQRGRTHEGSGIGLALVSELVKQHGGTIHVESREGKGSTFIVRVPFGTDHLPKDRIGGKTTSSAATTSEAFVAEALRWLPDAENGESADIAGVPPSSQQSAAVPRSRVLVADDNADLRDYLRRLLSAQFDVTTAAEGEEAFSKARGTRPDLILTDVMMPGVDGFHLLQKIRADEELRDTPVILLSARAGEEARIEGLAATADDYLVKPFSARELMARIAAQIALSRLRREAAEQERVLRAQAEAAEAKVLRILESITDGFVSLDREWRFNYVNSASERLLGRSRDDLLGRTLWDCYPDIVGTEVETQYRRAVALQSSAEFENYYPAHGRYYSICAYPQPEGGLSVFFRDVTEHRRAADALVATNEALRRSNDDLERFAYAASHDLQEPLRMVTSFTQLLRKKYHDRLDEDADRYIDCCVDGASQMRQLIDALLTYSRVVNNDDPVGQVDTEAVLRKAVANLHASITESGAVVTTTELPPVAIAEVQLLQVFQNLISNALKYRRPDVAPRIQVTAHRQGKHWRLAVSDNGTGIPPEYTETVFGFFKRLHGRDVPGTGIGLALCRRIIDRAGGRIWVESQPGQGSTFYFTLPATAPPTALRTDR